MASSMRTGQSRDGVISTHNLVSCLQLMAAGGNLRGRQFFKQHGWDDVGSDKIESKVAEMTAQYEGIATALGPIESAP